MGRAKKSDKEFQARMEKHQDELKWLYMELYQNEDMYAELCSQMYQYYTERKAALKKRDREREAHPDWYRRKDMLGMMLYIDNFAGNLKGVQKKWFHGKEKKELEQKITGKRQELKKAQETLSEIPKMQGYENALEVKKAYKIAVTELEGVRKLQSEWDQKGIPEKRYWVIKADVPEPTRQKSIHERLEEKKRDVERKQKKERKRSHGRDCL